MGMTAGSVIVKTILTTICVLFFFHIHDMEKSRKKIWRTVAGFAICFSGLFGSEVFHCAVGMKVVIMLLCITASMFLWKRFRLIRTFYLSVFICFLYFSSNVLVNGIQEWCAWYPGEGVADAVLTVLLEAGILISIMGIVRLVHVSYQDGISLKRQWFSFFIIMVNAMLLLTESMGNISVSGKTEVILLTFHLLCICVCGYALVTDYGKKQAEYLACIIKRKPFAGEQKEDEPEKVISDQRKKAHEYRNHMYCIYHLAQREGCREITEYIKELDSGMYETLTETFCTGNTIADAILNGKYRDAKAAGIDISMRTETLNGVIMKKEDITVLFSNLLNNAMEAAGKCTGSKEMHVEVKMSEGRMSVMVANTHSNVITETGGTFFTTKTEDVAEHGYGLSNIKEIVTRYNGECHIAYTENEFHIQVII